MRTDADRLVATLRKQRDHAREQERHAAVAGNLSDASYYAGIRCGLDLAIDIAMDATEPDMGAAKARPEDDAKALHQETTSMNTRHERAQAVNALKALRGEMFEGRKGNGQTTMVIGVEGRVVEEAAAAADRLDEVMDIIDGTEGALYRIAQGVENPKAAAREALERFGLTAPEAP